MPAPFTTPVAESVPFDNETNGFISEEVQSAIEEARDTAPGLSARYAVNFGYQGTASGKWLQFFNSIGSDQTPFVLNEDTILTGFSVAFGKITNSTLTVYDGVTLLYSFVVVNKTIDSIKNLTISLLEGSTLSVFCTKDLGAANNPSDVIFNVFLQTA